MEVWTVKSRTFYTYVAHRTDIFTGLGCTFFQFAGQWGVLTSDTMPSMAHRKGTEPSGASGRKEIGVVGQNLRRARDRKGWSQHELADRAELSRGTIADLERGHSQSPDIYTQKKLAAALDMDPADLWRGPGQPVSETRREQHAVKNLAPGLSDFLERHPELGPREIERLTGVAQSLPPGTAADEKVWQYHLAAIRRQLALEDGVL